jgi:amino acid adenylation domain-containing protein
MRRMTRDGALVHQHFQAQAEQTPEAIAAVIEGQPVSYADLDHRSNQLAHRLQGLGVGPEVVVGISLERSLELLVAILGVLKAGGAHLLLEPASPPARLALMLRDARPAVVVTGAQLARRLSGYAAPTVCLDPGFAILDGVPGSPPPSAVREGNLASLSYTSGSSGRPKAVMRAHLGGKHPSWAQTTFGLTPDDRHLLKTSTGFTVFLSELFWPLLTGGRVVVTRPDGERDSAYLVGLILEHRITVLQAVPSLLGLLVDEPGFEACRSLRHIITIGEAMPSGLPERLAERSRAELAVLYGTTEAPTAAFRRCGRGDGRPSLRSVRPLPDRRMFVVDHALQRVPPGTPGELCVGGRLARGYLGRPGLTAERFLPDPFSGDPGGRLYRTGDLARCDENGTVELLGRLDDQVKINGIRIEPGEIEATLTQHPGIRQSAVVVREDGEGSRSLVAYVTPAGTAPAPHDLRTYLAERLPDFMVPAAIVVLERLPLLASGKLDRQALPPPRPGPAPADAAPRNWAEEVVANIWAEVLGLEGVGREEDFFALGGHSLDAIRVLSRLRASLGVDLPVRTLFDRPTVALLAALVLDRMHEPARGNARTR